jgi:hypothetical protein
MAERRFHRSSVQVRPERQPDYAPGRALRCEIHFVTEDYMLRQAIPAVLITTALAIAACGGGGGDSDADNVRAAYNGFHRALASRHPESACKMMTQAGRQKFAEASSADTCERAADALSLMLAVADDAARDGLGNFRARGVIFANGHSKAVIQPDQIAMPAPWKRKDGLRPVVLVRSGGTWLIEDLGT